MGSLDRWLAIPPVARWVIGVGALLGGVLIVGGLLMGGNVFGSIFMGFVFGGPLVIVGVCAVRRPNEMPRVFGAFVGVCTAMLPSRLPIMCGATIGLYPALACSSLFVDPNPDDHGQTPSALIAYSLPLTLPFLVGLGGLMSHYLHRKIARALSPSG